MKKLVLFLCAGAMLALAGCAGVPLPDLGSAVSRNVDTVAADFSSDEILSAAGEGSMMEGRYHLAKVITPASSATKNQSQVLLVSDGSKSWVDWIIPSRKAEKADFTIGAVLFYPEGWAGFPNISGAEYRANNWRLGRVTSTDDLFKNIVEIAGESYAVKMIRKPTVAVTD
jgi:hypothetical protein